jgi:hypothetical protein
VTPTPTATESLFSYGTLQLESVQLATFGRKLEGASDVLPRFEKALFKIEDPKVVETSGKTHHPMAKFTGRSADAVAGTVFQITKEELENADRYEVDAYRRIAATLGSGVRAWVYVSARHAPPDA